VERNLRILDLALAVVVTILVVVIHVGIGVKDGFNLGSAITFVVCRRLSVDPGRGSKRVAPGRLDPGTASI
jgi:hypothetical protein